jgi:integrase
LTNYFSDLIASHSWSAVKLDLYGFKFSTQHVLGKPWTMPNFIKPPKVQRLPDIVTVEEAQALFSATRTLSYRVFYFTVYSMGLRLSEGLALKVGDIDATRHRVHVRDSKGNRDRFVPLPEISLCVLRRFWQTHRNPELLFPNRQGGLQGAHLARTPLDRGGVQKTLYQVAIDCGLKKNHTAQSAPQLCHASDRSRGGFAGSAKDSGPLQHPHHRALHPPHQPHQRSGQRAHCRLDEPLHA